MLGFGRFFVIGLVVMTMLYWLLSIYSRSVARERLEEEWVEEGEIGERDTYVDVGLAAYHASFRPKLLLLVYVIPTIVFLAIFYVTNFT